MYSVKSPNHVSHCSSRPPAVNVLRASRVKRPEAAFHPPYTSARSAKPPSIVNEPSCVDPVHSFSKGLKTTPLSHLTPALSNVVTPLDLPFHCCQSCGANSHCTDGSTPQANSHCTDSSTPQASAHTRSSLVRTNSTSTGSSYSKPIT